MTKRTEPQPIEATNSGKVGWRVKTWCEDTDVSKAYAYRLLASGVIKSRKLGSATLITTSPREFIESLPER